MIAHMLSPKSLLTGILKSRPSKPFPNLQCLSPYATCPEKPCFMTPQCKVALITGGADGMGFSIANHLLKAGAKGVAITGLDTCHGQEAVTCLNRAYGKNRAMFINSNSNCMVQLEETFKVVKDAYQHIDIVINSAAICDGPRWESEIVTNIIGTIRTTLLSYKYVGKEGTGSGGVVINISGIGGLNPMPPVPTLSCSYHGIVGLSRSFGDATHLSRSGVRVVCLCPGITSTNFHKKAGNQGMTDVMSSELVRYIKGSTKQTADVGGLAAIHLIKHASSGTVWVLEGSRLFVCNIPKWEKISALEAQYL